jgi:hypothetical protein
MNLIFDNCIFALFSIFSKNREDILTSINNNGEGAGHRFIWHRLYSNFSAGIHSCYVNFIKKSQVAGLPGVPVFIFSHTIAGISVPEFIDPRFHENKPKTLVFSHRKRAFWACFREN